jgi:hypothetical protein
MQYEEYRVGTVKEELKKIGCSRWERFIKLFKHYVPTNNAETEIMFLIGDNSSESRDKALTYFSSACNYLEKNKIKAFIRSESKDFYTIRSLLISAKELKKLQRKLADATK